MRIALVGLGEVGRVLAEELYLHDQTCWDIAFGDLSSSATRNAAELRLVPARDVEAAVAGASVVFSAVTAASAGSAAREAAAGMRPGAWLVDLNSASPKQKRAAADAAEGFGVRYVEAAVMSPIEPLRLAAPILLGGRSAREFVSVASALGFSGAEWYADTVGPASATKLCRSIVVKGMEALVTESMLVARVWGVERSVLDSLGNLFPAENWHELAGYLISRSLQHGTRRVEEMREAAAMVAAAGVDPVMTQATAERQAWAAAYRSVAEHAAAGDAGTVIDALRAQLNMAAVGDRR